MDDRLTLAIESIAKSIHRYVNTTLFHECDLNFDSRIIYLSDIIPEEGLEAYMANSFVRNVLDLEGISNDPITIILNSPGGDWLHGMGCFDKIKNSPCHIRVIVYGYCMSMGSIILQAADERIMSDHAMMMLHSGSEGFAGSAENLQSYAQYAESQLSIMYDIYQKRTGWTRKKIENLCKVDRYFTAREAVKEGLADYVLGEEPPLP